MCDASSETASTTLNSQDRVAVCSRSFSSNAVLRAELLARYAKVTINDAGRQLAGDALVEFLLGHDKAITALEVIDHSILGRLPELKVIGKYGVGLDMIDLAAMRKVTITRDSHVEPNGHPSDGCRYDRAGV